MAQGLWHATDPTGTWENLCNNGIGLPPFDPATAEGNYLSPLVDFCPRAPDRVYAWFARGDVTTGLYTTSAPTTSWTRVAATMIPNPAWGLYAYEFAVASNSPGDSLNDILLFGNIPVHRSIDGGRNWRADGVGFHADIHSFVFVPAVPATGVVPTTYLGCDGGIAASMKFADPAVAVETGLTDFNHGAAYSPALAGWVNLNHGKGSVAVIGYASDPNIAAVSFIGCQDTGVAAGEKTLGWRSLGDADVYTIAAARGMQGVSCWINYGLYSSWPGFRISRFSDRRTSAPFSWIGFGLSLVANTSNFALRLDGKMITGMVVRDGSRMVAAMIPTGVQTVTPSSMTDIRVGSRVVVESGVAGREEIVTVTAITGTTFTANFGIAHPAGSTLWLERAFVGTVGEDDLAQQISQDFGDNGRQVNLAIVDPTNANILYCATSDGDRVWTTNTATTAGPATVWVEIATNRPTGTSPFPTPLSWIAVDAAGTAYALWLRPVPDSTGAVVTPLYRLSRSWIAETVMGVPASNLGKLLGDPVRPNVLYMNSGNTVYRLEKVGTTWSFTDLGAGLPRAPVYDIWIANIGTAAAPKVLLRAAVTTRGIFESDVTAGAVDPPIALYVRDHLLDQGWLNPSPEGMPDPYNPSDPAATLWHYMCADVKIDTQTAGIFQTDPEGATPLSHVHFNMLRDNSQNLPQTATGKVHVMVHNRSRTPATNVRVWAIYCRASAGVPGLNVSPSLGNAFPFWNQFRADGTIVPSLPPDSPWTSVNTPITLPDVDADRPRVATFSWTIPTLTTGDTGHYCMAVFVHSAASPVGETTNMSVDSITPRNRQVGQKNLHIVAAGGGPGGGPGGGAGGAGGAPFRVREYVEFHNPKNAVRVASLRFDFRGLPPDARATLQFTPFTTRRPPAESFTGTKRPIRAPRRKQGCVKGCLSGCLLAPLRWLGSLVFGHRRPTGAQKPAHRLPEFEPWIHEAQPAAEVLVREVVLAPFERVGTLIELAGESLRAGERLIHVQQIVDGQVVGGSVYTIGMPEQKPPSDVVDEHRLDKTVIDPSEMRRREEEAEKWRYIPPWIKPIMEEREFELGKKIDPKRRAPVEGEDDDDDRNRIPV